MKQNKKGFTLIELLIVVLVIGILAVIAVPKYQTAVDKAKFSQLRHTTHAIANAENIYFLTHGQYTTSLKDLDISFSQGKFSGNSVTFKWGSCNLLSGGIPHCYISTPKVDYYVYPSYIQCAAETSSKRAMTLCRQELPGAKETYHASGYCHYPCTTFIK